MSLVQSLRSSLNRTISKQIKPFQSHLSNAATHVALQVYPETSKSASNSKEPTDDELSMKECTDDKDCQWVTEQPLHGYVYDGYWKNDQPYKEGYVTIHGIEFLCSWFENGTIKAFKQINKSNWDKTKMSIVFFQPFINHYTVYSTDLLRECGLRSTMDTVVTFLKSLKKTKGPIRLLAFCHGALVGDDIQAPVDIFRYLGAPLGVYNYSNAHERIEIVELTTKPFTDEFHYEIKNEILKRRGKQCELLKESDKKIKKMIDWNIKFVKAKTDKRSDEEYIRDYINKYKFDEVTGAIFQEKEFCDACISNSKIVTFFERDVGILANKKFLDGTKLNVLLLVDEDGNYVDLLRVFETRDITLKDILAWLPLYGLQDRTLYYVDTSCHLNKEKYDQSTLNKRGGRKSHKKNTRRNRFGAKRKSYRRG